MSDNPRNRRNRVTPVMTIRTAFVSVLAVVATGFSACSSPDRTAAPTESDVAMAVYPDIPALMEFVASEGGSVVVVRIVSSKEAPGSALGSQPIQSGFEGYVPATDSTAVVERIITGEEVAAHVTVHQLYGPDATVSTVSRLEVGSTYVAALVPFTFGGTGTGSQYQVAAQRAAWQRDANGNFRWIAPSDECDYPTTIRSSELDSTFLLEAS